MLRFKQSTGNSAGGEGAVVMPAASPFAGLKAAGTPGEANAAPTGGGQHTKRILQVGMGQLQLGGSEAELAIAGLGSCIGLAIWCPQQKVGALAHVVLPTSKGTPPSATTPAKFADWAVPKMLQDLTAKGAKKEELVAKMAGGAHPLAAASADVGRQSAEAIEVLLTEAGVQIAGKSIGGTVGRAVRFLPETGVLEVRQMNGAAEAL